LQRRPGTVYRHLVPNLQGFDKALESRSTKSSCSARRASLLAQEHQLLDRESIERFRPVAYAAKEARLPPSRQRLVRRSAALTRATFRRRT